MWFLLVAAIAALYNNMPCGAEIVKVFCAKVKVPILILPAGREY